MLRHSIIGMSSNLSPGPSSECRLTVNPIKKKEWNDNHLRDVSETRAVHSCGPSTYSSTECPVAKARSRCEPDPFYPSLAACTANTADDDRQGVSHFFGRNKKATESIPEYCYPLMCRIHYQEKRYRWGQRHMGSFSDFQCACIVKTLERMARMTFTDEFGNDWPWFCGFVFRIPTLETIKEGDLLISKPTAGERTIEASSNNEIVVEAVRTANVAEQDGTNQPHAEFQTASRFTPQWLKKLATKDVADKRYSIDEIENGVKYDLDQMITIVRAIGRWCTLEQAPLPKVEALPITIGMHFAEELEKAKEDLKEVIMTEDRAAKQFQPAGTVSFPRTLRKNIWMSSNDAMIVDDSCAMMEADLEATKHMIPGVRKIRAKVSSRSKRVLQQDKPQSTREDNYLQGNAGAEAGEDFVLLSLKQVQLRPYRDSTAQVCMEKRNGDDELSQTDVAAGNASKKARQTY